MSEVVQTCKERAYITCLFVPFCLLTQIHIRAWEEKDLSLKTVAINSCNKFLDPPLLCVLKECNTISSLSPFGTLIPSALSSLRMKAVPQGLNPDFMLPLPLGELYGLP